jgi:hypothetical protein
VQQVVTGGVAEAVVDLLEPVEVEQQECGGRLRGRRGDDPLRLLEQRAAVGQAGELVGPRLELYLVDPADLAAGHGDADDAGQHAAEGEPAGDAGHRLCPRRAQHDEARHEAGERHGDQPMREPVVGGSRPFDRTFGCRGGHDDAGQPAELERAAVAVGALHLEGEEHEVRGAEEAQPRAEQHQSAVQAHAEDAADGHEHGDEQDRGDRCGEVDGGHRCLAGVGAEVGAHHEGHPGGQGAEGGHDAVEPHARVEARHPRVD